MLITLFTNQLLHSLDTRYMEIKNWPAHTRYAAEGTHLL